MKPETNAKIDWLYGGPTRKSIMTKKEVEGVIDEIGTEIIVCGRLRTIEFKKIIGSRYKVYTVPFTE